MYFILTKLSNKGSQYGWCVHVCTDKKAGALMDRHFIDCLDHYCITQGWCVNPVVIRDKAIIMSCPSICKYIFTKARVLQNLVEENICM